MTESSESADIAHQSSLPDKTSDMEKNQCPDAMPNCYSKASEENGTAPYVGNYYAGPYLQYPTEAQWPLGDANGYQYAPAYIPYRGYEGYDWYAPEYRQEWNAAADTTTQTFAPMENYYYLDGYATANGSAEGGTTEEFDLEQSFSQLGMDGYASTYKNQFGGWNAMGSQPFLQYSSNRFTDYSQYQNKSKSPMWDASKTEPTYRNGGSIRYWSASRDQNKFAENQTDKNMIQSIPAPSNEENPNASIYNQKNFDLDLNGARYFVIKSYSEDDIHRSIKYGIWCSTEYGNKRLDAAFREREGKGNIYLFFSVNGSGHFCGVAAMTSPVDYDSGPSVWAQNKWKGKFDVRWIYVKDVPNSQLRHIKLENNENKPVTNSRDTQEVPVDKGKQVLYVIHQYLYTTSIFDDFQHYEQRLHEDNKVKPTG